MSPLALIARGTFEALDSRRRGRGEFAVVDPVVWSLAGHRIEVRSGFITDGASIPGWARWAIDPWGPCGLPAVLHDFLITETDYSKRDCDWLFLGALHAQGVSDLQAAIMWLAVRTKRKPAAVAPVAASRGDPEGVNNWERLTMHTARTLAVIALLFLAVLLPGAWSGVAQYFKSDAVKAAQERARAAAAKGELGGAALESARAELFTLFKAFLKKGVREHFAALWARIVSVKDWPAKIMTALKGLDYEGARQGLDLFRRAFITIMFAIAAVSCALRLVVIPLSSYAQGGGADEGAAGMTIALIIALLALEALERGKKAAA